MNPWELGWTAVSSIATTIAVIVALWVAIQPLRIKIKIITMYHNADIMVRIINNGLKRVHITNCNLYYWKTCHISMSDDCHLLLSGDHVDLFFPIVEMARLSSIAKEKEKIFVYVEMADRRAKRIVLGRVKGIRILNEAFKSQPIERENNAGKVGGGGLGGRIMPAWEDRIKQADEILYKWMKENGKPAVTPEECMPVLHEHGMYIQKRQDGLPFRTDLRKMRNQYGLPHETAHLRFEQDDEYKKWYIYLQ